MLPNLHDHPRFSPPHADVAEYQRIRNASRDLHGRIVEAIPAEAMEEMGEALGLRSADGVLVLPFEDAADVFMDACLYGWFRDERNLVEDFARSQTETGKPRLPRLEAQVLQAARTARHRVFRIVETVTEVGVHAIDGRTSESFFLMDVTLSTQTNAVGAWLSSRVVTFGEWSMTTGAALCLGQIPDAVLRGELDKLDAEFAGLPPTEAERQVALTLTILGLQLRAEQEEGLQSEFRPGPSSALPSGRPGRNDPCPCGSGKKHKRCCGP